MSYLEVAWAQAIVVDHGEAAVLGLAHDVS